MLLSELKHIYQQSLASLYPIEEINSLFDWVVEHYLSLTRLQLHQQMDKNTSPEAEKKIIEALNRLIKSEPVQYIVGWTEFYDLKFKVSPDVLIPRQETEYLVHLMLKDLDQNQDLSIADLCTGSGCIAIALAKNLPQAQVLASDISENALLIAKDNATQHNVTIQFIQDDLLNSMMKPRMLDVIVSNPPYVRMQEKKYMHSNVLNYEPELALFVDDDDPLPFYRAIAHFAQKHLKEGGVLYLEINEYLGSEMRQLYEECGFHEINILNDLNNKPRFLKVKR